MGRVVYITYGVNQRRNREQHCFAWGTVVCCSLTFPMVEQDEKLQSRWVLCTGFLNSSLMGELHCSWQCLQSEITVWKKTNTIPVTQAQNHNILPDSHFLFFCWFLLSHSISLGVNHRYFTALSLISSGCFSSPLPFFAVLCNNHHNSLCFSVMFCTKQSINSVSLLHAKRFH